MTARSRRSFLKVTAGALSAAGATAAARLPAQTASSQDRVAGANRRVRVAPHRLRRHGHGRPARHAALGRAVRRALRRGRRAEREGRATSSVATSARRRTVVTRDFRQRARSRRHRRRHRRHARPLARAADGDGVRGGQGRLRREAAVADDRRGSRDGRRRAPAQARRPDGDAAAQRAALRRRGRVREERHSSARSAW